MQSKQDEVSVGALREKGVRCESVYDFVNGATPPEAVPVLIELLGVVTDPAELEGVVRALATTAARGRAERPLISLFRSLVADTDRIALLKWAIGNTLSVLDQDALGEELLAIAADRSHGTSRQMIVAGLRHLGTPDPTSTLIDLLEDETVNGHAAVALGQRRSERALQHLHAFAERESGWKRRNALTAIRRIGKGAKTSKPSKDGDGS